MKKLFFFAAAALAALTVNAQITLNNPIGTDGHYIVKWDCEAGKFAAANDFEPGETVTIAFDITGTVWASELQNPKVGGTTRAMAANIWTNYGPKQEASNRLKEIAPNIWGATYNFKQQITAYDPTAGAKIQADSILYASCQLFIFAHGDVLNEEGKMVYSNGVEWYQNAAEVKADGSNELFATLPSTGRVDEEIYCDEDGEGMYKMEAVVGYASPCAGMVTAIENTAATVKSQKVIENGQLVLIKGNARYNVLGATLK